MSLPMTFSNPASELYEAVWLDMDGVLADFLAGALRHTGRTHLKHEEFSDYDIFPKLGTTCDEFFRSVGEDFWAELPPCPEFEKVTGFAFASGRRVGIASMPPPHRAAEAVAGKTRWLKKYLPGVAEIRFIHDKHVLAGPRTLLIDDLPRNVEKFRAAGGDAHLLPRPWNQCAA